MTRSDGPPLEVSASGLSIRSHVDIWHAGKEVALKVPVGSGTTWAQADLDVPERVDIALPRVWEDITLDPGSKDGLLAADGHQVQLTVTLSSPAGEWEQKRGRFRIEDYKRDGASVRCVGHGPLSAVRGRKRATPYAPGRPSPIAGEVESLLASCGLEAWVHPDLSRTRRVPADFVQGRDMWKALQELLTAWPAVARMGGHGEVRLLPGLPADLPAPDVWWHDGVGGTVVEAPMEGTREGVHNHVIVDVKPATDDQPEFAVEDWIKTGLLRPEVFGWNSLEVGGDAVTSRPQAQLVIANQLARAGLRSRVVPVSMVPDWQRELDDVAHVKTGDGVEYTGRVTGIELPLTDADGPGAADVGVVI